MKVYFPKTEGILRFMSLIYCIVFLFGSVLNLLNSYDLNEWVAFFQISLIYIGVCLLLYVLIKSQRIVVNEDVFILKVIGLKRYQIQISTITEIRKGKMNGSPIIEILTIRDEKTQLFRVPYIPFEHKWDELFKHIKEKRGKEVIGEMTLQREKGELRTWEEQ